MAKRKKPVAVSKTPAPIADDMSTAQKIAWWSILVMVFITPIAIANLSFLGFKLPLSFDQFDIIKVFCQRVFTLIALAAWTWHICTKGGKIRRTPVDWLILAFLGWVTISTIFSIHPPTAFFGKYRRFEGLLSFINYAVIYFLVMQFADRPSRVKQLAQTLFWSGVVVAGYGVMQFLGMDIIQWNQLPFEARRAFSTYGNPDLLGGFLMFSTFVSIGLALAEQKLVMRGVYWFGFLLSSLCVVVAFTRSAWIGFIVGFAFFLLFAIYQRTEWKTEDWVFSGSTAVLVIASVVQSLSNPNEVMNFGKRFASITKFGEGSAKTRFEIWHAAIDSIKDRPIFGFGPDTFRLVFPRYKPIEYVNDAGYLSVADNVHNYPLQLASGIGVPGMLMMYGIFGWAAARSWKIVFNREGGPNRMIVAGFWCAAAAYVTHLFFGLSVTGASFLMWIAVAVVLAPTAVTVEVRPASWAIFVAAGVILLAVFGISYQFVIIQADRAYLVSRIASSGSDRTAYSQKAARLNPFNDMYRAEVGLAFVDESIYWAQQLGSAEQGSEAQTTAFNNLQTTFRQGVDQLQTTIDFVPWEYDNYVFLSNLYALGGDYIDPKYYAEAERVAREGVKVERYGPAIRFQLARALLSQNKPQEAIKELAYAHKMDIGYYEVALLLAQAYEQQGQPDKALAVLKETALRNPQPQINTEIQRLEASATTPAQ